MNHKRIIDLASVGEYKPAGDYEVEFDARNLASGMGYASGVYFYKLTSGAYSSTKKMILLK